MPRVFFHTNHAQVCSPPIILLDLRHVSLSHRPHSCACISSHLDRLSGHLPPTSTSPHLRTERPPNHLSLPISAAGPLTPRPPPPHRRRRIRRAKPWWRRRRRGSPSLARWRPPWRRRRVSAAVPAAWCCGAVASASWRWGSGGLRAGDALLAADLRTACGEGP